jgi:hypothetical protein
LPDLSSRPTPHRSPTGSAQGSPEQPPRSSVWDAVFSKVPLVLNEGDELGQWELEKVNDLLTMQSGVYSYTNDDKIENKTRGFAAGNVASMGIARDPAEFPKRGARDVGKLGWSEGEADLEAIESRLELEGIPDKKRKMLTFREALLNKVPDAWRQATFKPDGSKSPSPEIVLMLQTFMTAGPL